MFIIRNQILKKFMHSHGGKKISNIITEEKFNTLIENNKALTDNVNKLNKRIFYSATAICALIINEIFKLYYK